MLEMINFVGLVLIAGTAIEQAPSVGPLKTVVISSPFTHPKIKSSEAELLLVSAPSQQQSTERAPTPKYQTRSRDRTKDNDALSHSYDQDTAIYCWTTSIGCSANQVTALQTVELHHKT